MSQTLTPYFAPIALIVFNRPVHTAKVLSALSANEGARESHLIIYSDAQRDVRDEEAVAAVRKLARETVGFKSVTLVERPCNYGCSKNVLAAISETLEMHERCIVVEDDIETSPLFLSYMNQALDVYAEDERFYSIGAYTYSFKIPTRFKESTFMAQRHCSWGWATWKRAWIKMDFEQATIDMGLENKAERMAFAKACGADWLRTYQRVPDIWDLRVTFQAWRLGLYTLYPVVSFTRNIGKDGSGVNYDGGSLNSVDTEPLADCLPVFNASIAEHADVLKAFLRPMKKPRWRQMAIWVTRSLRIYDVLLARANRR